MSAAWAGWRLLIRGAPQYFLGWLLGGEDAGSVVPMGKTGLGR